MPEEVVGFAGRLSTEFWPALQQALPSRLLSFRWFGGKSRQITRVDALDFLPLGDACLCLLTVNYAEGLPDTYLLPVMGADISTSNIASESKLVEIQPQSLVLYEATSTAEYQRSLIEAVFEEQTIKGQSGTIRASLIRSNRVPADPSPTSHAPRLLKAEQSNTSIVYGDRYILKVYRRIESGMNPDIEVGRFLTERTQFCNSPAAVATLDYRPASGKAATLAALFALVENLGDAWSLFQGKLAALCSHKISDESEGVAAIVEETVQLALLLGRRTAEMHIALGSVNNDPAFAPESFTLAYQQGVERSLKAHADFCLHLVKKVTGNLPTEVQAGLKKLTSGRKKLIKLFEMLGSSPIAALRTRTHGDYHLGQVLYTGSDFMIIDFEGEPARPIHERTFKCSPLRDLAGMLRSFHYAASVALFEHGKDEASRNAIEPLLEDWHTKVTDAYCRGYHQAEGIHALLPATDAEQKIVLDAYMLEKAFYELLYEVNNRPTWVRVPLNGILRILGSLK